MSAFGVENTEENVIDKTMPYQILDETPIYHMCLKQRWEQAKREQRAYLPPTFQKDGYMTHGSHVPTKMMLKTANHFYQSSSPPTEQWICLQLNPNVLWQQLGVVTLMESPAAVGTTAATTTATKKVVFPHIYGGIPTTVPNVVTTTYPMTRDPTTGEFLAIPGLILEVPK